MVEITFSEQALFLFFNLLLGDEITAALAHNLAQVSNIGESSFPVGVQVIRDGIVTKEQELTTIFFIDEV